MVIFSIIHSALTFDCICRQELEFRNKEELKMSTLTSGTCLTPVVTLQRFVRGVLPLRSNPLPFVYHFDRKGSPFRYLLLKIGDPY